MRYFIPLLAFVFLACAPPKGAQYEPLPVPAPDRKPETTPEPVPAPNPDSGAVPLTNEEKLFFAQEQKQVEQAFVNLGHQTSLKIIPVYLLAKIKNDDQGKCIRKDMLGPDNPFKEEQIRISGNNMAADLLNRNVQSGRFMSQTRITYIHELGHCYFKKNHNVKTISTAGYKLVVGKDELLKVPKSMMITGKDVSRLPAELTRYYVGEILGLWTADSLYDVASRVSGARVVKQ